MTFVAAGAIVVSSFLGANSAQNAANTQADAARYAADLQAKQWEDTKAMQKPWLEAGQSALNRLVPLAENYTPFSMNAFRNDPGYAFRLSEGQKALNRQAAARGGLISGSALKNAQRFGQTLASEEYQNAFNRYQAERAAQLSPLQSLAGVGQSTSQSLGNLGANTAAQIGNNLTDAAQARASGYVGATNALTSGLNTGLNYYQGNNLLAALNNRFPQQSAQQYPSFQDPYSNVG